MGHEVMDAHGGHQPPSSGSAPVDIVDLGDVSDVSDLGPDDGPAVDGSRERTTGSPGWRGALSGGGGRSVVLPLAVALVAGALIGGFVSGQRSAADQRSAQRAQLAVVAQVESSSGRHRLGVVRAELTARVTNTGPEPVEVESAPGGTEPSRSRPVVVTGGGALAPGSSTTVRVQALVPCARADRPGPAVTDLVVTVRTADDRTHGVPLAAASGTSLEALCGAATGPTARVSARLEGTLAQPVVVIDNEGAAVVGVSFDSVVSKGSADLEGLVTILTTPAMPLIVRAGRERGVAVDVRASRCVRDLDALGGLDDISSPQLIVTDANGAVLSGGGSVDLGLLVNQALTRACE